MSRFDYIKYDEKAAQDQLGFKTICQQLEAQINQLGSGRPKSIALAKLEEVYMWIGKSIRDEQVERLGVEGTSAI